ncbi:hypothetical protein AAG570_006097, partial [Ranatra chinensis]
FPVYWNVPTFQCHKYGLNFSQVRGKWGIVQNYQDQFRGERLAILYDPGEFPALLSGPQTSGKVPRNGGVPQEGNLNRHLEIFANQLEKLVPDPNFNGLGVIDFEHWRPVWRQNWGSLNVYREHSRAVEKRKHPFWFHYMHEKEAIYRYELKAKAFMLETLRTAKALRPSAKWGYYGYPFCFNFTPNNNRASCSTDVLTDNDGMDWLYSETSGFYPSLYLRERGLTHTSRERFMAGRLTEAMRVARGSPVYPYIWYKYHDSRQFLDPDDMLSSIRVAREKGAAGVVVWGASNDVNTRAKCFALADYLDNVLGPALMRARSSPPQEQGPPLPEDGPEEHAVVVDDNTIQRSFRRFG